MKENRNYPSAYCLRDTPFGPVAVLWSPYGNEPEICRILLSSPEIPAGDAVKKIFPRSESLSCREIDDTMDQIESFLSGEDILFSLHGLCLDRCSSFQRSVLLADYAIPRGRVSTYQRLAKHLGNPKGARAVGTALAKNPFPLIIPCHRAIRSDGGLGGFQYGLKMKRALLELEGIAFRDNEHVATLDFFYQD
jgi:methylated-DNA-[protein]-cysteine S-methyltransferase